MLNNLSHYIFKKCCKWKIGKNENNWRVFSSGLSGCKLCNSKTVFIVFPGHVIIEKRQHTNRWSMPPAATKTVSLLGFTEFPMFNFSIKISCVCEKLSSTLWAQRKKNIDYLPMACFLVVCVVFYHPAKCFHCDDCEYAMRVVRKHPLNKWSVQGDKRWKQARKIILLSNARVCAHHMIVTNVPRRTHSPHRKQKQNMLFRMKKQHTNESRERGEKNY